MTLQAELLDKVRERCSIPSDNALSRRLHVGRSLISGWRSGAVPMPDERIAQLCALAHIEAAEWLARLHAERAESALERRAWLSILERLRPAAAVAGLAMTLWLSIGPGHASDAQGVCIMRIWRRRIALARRLLRRALSHFTEAPAHGLTSPVLA